MQRYLTELRSLHGELVAALDGRDVARVSALVARRAELLEDLRRDFENAAPPERESLQPDLSALLPLDRDLQSRAGALRDLLRREIAGQRDSAPRAPRPTITGILDRQA